MRSLTLVVLMLNAASGGEAADPCGKVRAEIERAKASLAGTRELISLPSTSPAYASMRFEDKLARWRDGLGL